MRYLIVGCGNVGLELARIWTADGHEVVGTTTSVERTEEVGAVCTQVAVLRGSDAAAVRAAAAGVDAVVLTVSPRFSRSLTPADRVAEYADTLTATAQCAAAIHPRVVFASSTSVYGAARSLSTAANEALTELDPTTEATDASPVNFLAAERAVLGAEHGAVVRLPDVYGHPRDIDYVARVRLAHDVMAGAVPFASDSLLYRIDYRDAAAAVRHVVDGQLDGVFNAAPDIDVPRTNEEVFGAISDANGWPRLTYRAQIEGPTRPISSAKLRSSGFTFVHSTAA